MKHALRFAECPWASGARLRLGRCRSDDMSFFQHCQELGRTCISGSHYNKNWHDTLSGSLCA